MNYQDFVYGHADIDEPVLIELINTAAMQRLKGVLQHGITAFLGITRPITRFEHSVGAMLLARHFKAPLTEQIAALLHDVSHTAFSHVTDHVFSTPTGESFHEIMKETYLRQSDIPQTLARYGYDWRDFLDDSVYPILERPAPSLCADRLDYFFRDSLALEIITHEMVTYMLSHLVIWEKQIVVNNLAAARLLAEAYIQADEQSWSSLQAIGLYQLTASAIRRALEVHAIQEIDVWGTDNELWDKLMASQDSILKDQIAGLSSTAHFVEAAENPLFVVTPKIRTVDPFVLIDGHLAPLSALDAAYWQRREVYLEKRQRPFAFQRE
ncbi:HD domain-containing protein [Siphonobacter aquaeclarae]|uniref:HD domain-containing protein n=1 Tax=Siphonobacter aquaeclarae TaxID=563176 RepID=A0A1G9UDM5_9BACT|nr:HD domain-containing protein [Siphonobacter aquaeclarae]SDM58018.1 HD domain-containing protein [Siphonobacter aquaeclarae]